MLQRSVQVALLDDLSRGGWGRGAANKHRGKGDGLGAVERANDCEGRWVHVELVSSKKNKAITMADCVCLISHVQDGLS